jgi:hypothetical protein
MTVKMPDVSEFQTASSGSAPNWAGIKAQNGGAAIIRVGYGITHLDGMFVSNYTALKQQNFAFKGLYHYLRADQDALTQAGAFCNWVGPRSALAPGSIPMLDLEEGGGNQFNRALTWLNFVDHFYGLDQLPLDKRSWLYSGQFFAVNAGLSPIFNSARHTWIAAYQSSEAGLLPHTLWQSTNGQVGANKTNWSGAGFCDTSITSHSLDELAAMAFQPNVPNPPDPTPQEDGMPSGHVTQTVGLRQTEGWPSGSVKQIVLHSDWQGVQASPPVVKLRIAHMNSGTFDAGNQTVDETDVYTIDNITDNNGCSFTRIDSGAATVAWHTNAP